MISSTPKFQQKKIVITLIIIFIVSVVIFIYREGFIVGAVQGAVQSIFSQPKSSLFAIGKDDGKNTSALEKKIRELEERLVDYELMKQDNAALKNQFEISGETTTSLIAAKIVGFQGENKTPREFIINVGEKDSIKKGMTVISQKYFIGKIDIVSRNYSVVITAYNPKLRVLAKIPETNASGLVVGQNDFILLDGVVITDQLKKGGTVVTKGEVDKTGVGIVPDMIIGKIYSISKNETAPFQSAEITPQIQYSKLSNVFVIAKM